MEEGRTFSMEDVWLLVKRVQEGDTGAYEEVYRACYDRVYALAYSLLRHKEDAEDVTSDAFLSVLRNIGNYQPKGREFVAVLLRAVRNKSMDRLRPIGQNRELPVDVRESTEFFGDVRSAEDIALGQMESWWLWDIVRTLPVRQRECLVLRFFAGVSVTDTAQRMGATVGATKTLQYRATEQLRQKIARDLRD